MKSEMPGACFAPILTALVFSFYGLASVTTPPLPFIAFSWAFAEDTGPSERLAQETPGVAEVPSGGKPAQEIGTLLRAEVDSLQVLGEGKVVVFLSFINKAKEDLHLSLYRPQEKTFATDDQGVMYRYENDSGLGSAPSRPLLCPAGGQATASLVFSPSEKNDRRGWSFSVTSELTLRGDKTRESHINLSFRGVRPQNIQGQER